MQDLWGPRLPRQVSNAYGHQKKLSLSDNRGHARRLSGLWQCHGNVCMLTEHVGMTHAHMCAQVFLHGTMSLPNSC